MFNYRNSKGFSLIELLVGMAIIITATTVILGIIVSSFRISSKSTSLDTVRQNGNYAMGRMSKMIQFADSFGGVSSDDGATYSTACPDNRQYSHIKITHAGTEKVFKCSGSSIYLGSDKLISPKISTVSCSFRCKKVDSNASPVISIKFDLTLGTAETVFEKKAAIPFSTSVLMRNK